MNDFVVKYSGASCAYDIISKVFAIDTVRSKFLIADNDGCFHWAPIGCCRLISKEETEGYVYD